MSEKKTDLPEKQEPAEYQTALSQALNAAFDKSENEPKEEAPVEPKAAKEVETAEPVKDKVEDNEDTKSEPKAEPDEQAAKSEEDAEAKETPKYEPHPRWSKEQKESFAKLPKDQQAFILERAKETEADYTRKSQEISEKAKRYESFEQVLQPYEQHFRQQGIPIERAIRSTFDLQQEFQRDPAGVLRRLAAARGLDLVDVALGENNPQGQAQQQQLTPDQLIQQAQEAAYQRLRQEQAQQQQVQMRQSLERELSNAEKYPRAEELGPDLVAQVYAVRQSEPSLQPEKVLEKAYQRALRVRDDYYEAELAKAREEAVQGFKSETEKAKKAGKPVRPKGTPSNKPAPTGEQRTASDVINSVLDEHGW